MTTPDPNHVAEIVRAARSALNFSAKVQIATRGVDVAKAVALALSVEERDRVIIRAVPDDDDPTFTRKSQRREVEQTATVWAMVTP